MLRFATLVFIHPTENHQIKAFKLKQSVKVFNSASNSAILSLAAYLTWKYPALIPEGASDILSTNVSSLPREDTFPSPCLSLHPYFELWSDKLCDAIFKGFARREENTLYISMRIGENGVKFLENEEWEISFHNENVNVV